MLTNGKSQKGGLVNKWAKVQRKPGDVRHTMVTHQCSVRAGHFHKQGDGRPSQQEQLRSPSARPRVGVLGNPSRGGIATELGPRACLQTKWPPACSVTLGIALHFWVAATPPGGNHSRPLGTPRWFQAETPPSEGQIQFCERETGVLLKLDIVFFIIMMKTSSDPRPNDSPERKNVHVCVVCVRVYECVRVCLHALRAINTHPWAPEGYKKSSIPKNFRLVGWFI